MTAGNKLSRHLMSLGLAAGIGLVSVGAKSDPLRARIEAMARERGIQVQGAELIGTESALPANTRETEGEIRHLLGNYNFVIVRNAQGRVARLTVIGPRASPNVVPENKPLQVSPGPIERYVSAVLTGPNGLPLPVRVMVDTGASTLVLARSLVPRFGFSEHDLRKVRVQTANGMADGVLATLQSVRVGDAESKHVVVTFVEDRLLGDKQLLGMSFLGRFRMTIDGVHGSLQLEKRSN